MLVDAIEALRRNVPRTPEDPEPAPDVFGRDHSLDAKRADALVALARSAGGAAGRPTVVVHVELAHLVNADAHGEIERGGVVPPETLQRLLCDCDLEATLHDHGRIVGLSSTERIAPERLKRQLRKRDVTCSFPGCHCTLDLEAHHVRHWIAGGETELYNLALLCAFHHTLMHEHGWSMTIGTPMFFRPDGRPFVPAPAPYP